MNIKRLKQKFADLDTAFRRWLCKRNGHKFRVGGSGYYVGMPQSHCWRCGKKDNQIRHLKDGPEYQEPQGGWFN